MKRSDLNFLIDAVAFLGLILLVSTGLIMRFILPPFRGGRGGEIGPSLLWGWDRHQWGEIHFWIAAGLLIVMAVHLFLHWKWIASVFQGKPREGSGIRFSLGVLSLVVLVVVAVSPFFSPTEQKLRRGKHAISEKGLEKNPEEKKPVSEKETHAQGIRGSMTLKEIEKTTGVPVAYILEKLGLPEDTDLENRLGRLRGQYGFEMQDVREIVENYRP